MEKFETIKLDTEYRTRHNNYPVRVLCVDAPGDRCVIAYATRNDGSIKIYRLFADGRLKPSSTPVIITPKKILPDEVYLNFYKTSQGEITVRSFNTLREAEAGESKFVTSKFIRRQSLKLTNHPVEGEIA